VANVWLPFASDPLSGMFRAVEPFCSASLKPTKPLTLPVKVTEVGPHLEHPGVEPLQLANDAARRHRARALRKVILFLSL
jgi:hypothetical protein